MVNMLVWMLKAILFAFYCSLGRVGWGGSCYMPSWMSSFSRLHCIRIVLEIAEENSP